jgi:hypothetical protein
MPDGDVAPGSSCPLGSAPSGTRISAEGEEEKAALAPAPVARELDELTTRLGLRLSEGDNGGLCAEVFAVGVIMLINLSAVYDFLFLLCGVLVFCDDDDVGWDASAIGEMYISRLATPIGRFFWRALGLDVVELDVME